MPLVFDAAQWAPFAELSGVALEVVLRNLPGSAPHGAPGQSRNFDPGQAASGRNKGKGKRKGSTDSISFLEDLLFTHRGLSGPAILQISTFWNPGEAVEIDLAPGQDLAAELLAAKPGNRQQLLSVLSKLWPRRLAEQWLAHAGGDLAQMRLAEVPDRRLQELAQQIHHWRLTPAGTAGYRKAEVMRGGVDTDELDQRSMQSRKVPGLYFIGEAVDVTGWLGGYNFQWAWSSAVACGRALAS